MEKKWNLQDIRPAKRKPAKRPAPSSANTEDVPPARPKPRPRPQRKQTRGKKPLLLGLTIAALIVVPGLLVGYVLNGAEITIEPKTREPNVNARFTALSEPGAGELGFEVMTLEATGERQVSASGEEEVSEQATGFIEVMNTSDSSERLIKNTRFESPNGLIFRITESVVVPAGTTDNPGTVRAEVFADEPGEEYNIEPTTFTIPGYEEGGYTALFESITGRSTTQMQGGFEGISYVVDDAELASAKDSLHEELRGALRERVDTERPAGFVLFDDGITYTYESLPSEESGENMVTLREKVRLHAPMFASEAFATFLAAETVPGYENEPVRINDPSALSFSYTSSTTAAADLRNVGAIEFQMSGRPLVVWTFDQEQLKSDLAGAARTALQTVLSGYPAIERAEAVIRPFWKRSFPDDPDDIDITENLE